jgi:hypothetical protein
MDEYDKKNEETNRKFSTLLQVGVVYWVNSLSYDVNQMCCIIFID